MLKRLIVGGLIGAAGFLAFGAQPAVAQEVPGTGKLNNFTLINLQTCRSVDVAGAGAAIHNLLGITYEHGDCYNGTVVTR